MHTLLTSLAGIIAAPILFVAGLLGGHHAVPPAPTVQATSAYDIYHIHATETALAATAKAQGILGASNPLETPIAVFHTSLANAISSSATSMTLVSALTADGTTLASSTYSFVLDSGQATQEFVIADCNGTSCTNMQRGLSVVNGTTTIASNQYSHRRTASVDIVDAPLLIKIASFFNGISGLPNTVYYQTEPNWTTATGTTLVTLNKLLGTAFGSAVVSTNSGGTGLTNSTLPINTMLVYPGTGGVLVGTSSPTFPYATFGYVKATSTVATSTFPGPIQLGGATYTFPASDGSAASVLQTSGAGILSWGSVTLSASSTTYIATSTYTKPAGTKLVHVQLWGAGGSGGRNATQNSNGNGGGGGGSYIDGWYTAAQISGTQTVTIGAGGAAVPPSVTANGLPGGNTSFGTLLTAYGGGGGQGAANGAVGGAGGCLLAAGGTATTTASSPGPAFQTLSLFCSGGLNATTTDAMYSTGGSGARGGGTAVYGGAGGGGWTPGTTLFAPGGSSMYGGTGGKGGTDNGGTTCGNGIQPGGGGGGFGYNGVSQLTGCAGGDGEAIITSFF